MHSHKKTLNFGHYIPNDLILEKKIPENPRYKHVKPAINTGQTVLRKIDELREKQKSCYHKKDEVFNRIKFANFIELIIEAGKVYLSCQNEKVNGTREQILSSKEVKKQKGLTNVIMGIGEIDLVSPQRKPATPTAEKEFPYLLLDVREKEKYLQCHFKTARHYPSALLTRSIGYETEDLKLYKNCNPEIIILYDEDESIATRVATTLTQRGYDNIFLLTGGLKYCNEVFPRKPLSNLYTSSLLEQNRCPSPIVQIKSLAVEYFSQEDIDIIEQYMDFPRNAVEYGAVDKTESLNTFFRSDKSGDVHVPIPDRKPASLTYRVDSAKSTTSFAEVRTKMNKSALDTRTKNKKAPWK